MDFSFLFLKQRTKKTNYITKEEKKTTTATNNQQTILNPKQPS
jgi:hypothetical protein